MIGIKSSGSFRKTRSFLGLVTGGSIFSDLHNYGRIGVDALSSATPRRSGLTAQSWDYNIVRRNGRYTIEWINTNINQGSNIAILIQYGHGTGTGGYISGYDYINPAIRPIFDKLATDVWERVKNG